MARSTIGIEGEVLDDPLKQQPHAPLNTRTRNTLSVAKHTLSRIYIIYIYMLYVYIIYNYPLAYIL